MLYKYNRKKKIVSSYYLIVHSNGTMFYFKDRLRRTFIGMHCLLLSYVVNDRPILRNINGTNYYGFEMTICDKVKEFLCKSEEDCKLWISTLRSIIKSDGFKNNYKLDTLIKEGKLCSVYKAINLTTKETVAVKVIDKTKLTQKSLMLYNEVLIMKYLNHPNIVKCHGQTEDNNYFYMELEYCMTGDLSRCLWQNKNSHVWSFNISILRE